MLKPLRAVLYARVSTDTGQQDTESQLLALRKLCADRGYRIVKELDDRVSGDPARRDGDPPGLRKALVLLQQRKADVLVIFAADRLVRSAIGLLELVDRIQSYGAKIASLQDGADLDTTTDVGQLVTFIKGWFARMNNRLTSAPTIAGLERARAQGTRLGRPRIALNDDEFATLAEPLLDGRAVRWIARVFNAPRSTVDRVKQFLDALPLRREDLLTGQAFREWQENGGPEAWPLPEGRKGDRDHG